MTTTTAPSEIAQQIRIAYETLAEHPGAPVRLLAISWQLDLTREQLHQGLRELARSGAGLLEPEPKQRALTQEDHEIAVRVGGERKDLLSILR